MENIIEDINSQFPSKPIEETKPQTIFQFLISLGLFIGVFMIFFKWNFTYILVLAGIIFIHELGHYLAMRIYNYKDLGIFFVPMMGAFATGTKDQISQKQQVIILLAGPLPGVIIGLILGYFGLKYQNPFLLKTANIFVILNLFNLLPIIPFDGGRILKTMFFENNEIINKIFILISTVLLTYYAISSSSYILLILPVFLVMQLISQSQLKKIRKSIESKGINLDKTYDELTDAEYWLIRDEIGIQTKKYEQFITPKEYEISENEQRIIKEVKSIIYKKPVKDLKIIGKILITALWVLTLIVPFIVTVLYLYVLIGR